MCRLTEAQISDISNRLNKDRIDFSHLYDDLLDHICCEIESLMEQGTDYTKAYQLVFNKIGLNGLKEIQEATIFYVKLNLIVMKKVMNVLAITGTSILVVSQIFKINHWPGGSILLFLGFLVLLFGFFPFALLSLRKDLSTGLFSKKFVVYLIGFVCLVETGAAFLFTSMHWPGGNYLMIISWVLLMLVFFPLLFVMVIRSNQNRIINISLAIFALMFIGSSIVQTYNRMTNPMNTSEFAFISDELEYYQAIANKEIESISQNKLDSLTDKLQKFNATFTGLEETITKYQKTLLNGKPDIYEVSQSILHKTPMNPEYDNRLQTLKESIITFNSDAQALCGTNAELAKFINSKFGLNPSSVKDFDNSGLMWEKRYFSGNETSFYTGLERILKDAYQVKSEIIRNLKY
jgi:hypothetical protein